MAGFMIAAQGESQERTATERRDRLEAMARIGSCSSPTFSPDGKRIALISNLSGIPQVWIVPVAGGWPLQVSALADPVTAVAWSPGGDELAMLVAPGGGMNQQIFLINSDGTKLRRLTAGGADNNSLELWSKDGNVLAGSSNLDNPDSMDAVLYFRSESDRFKRRLVARNGGKGYFTDISRDGRRAIITRTHYRGDNNLILLTLGDDDKLAEERILTAHEPPGTFTHGKFSPDGGKVYLASNNGREFSCLAVIDLDQDGSPGPMRTLAEHPAADLESICITDDGLRAALVWNHAGKSELALIDLDSLETVHFHSLPAAVINEISFSPDGIKLALTMSGAARPQDIWVLDTESRSFKQLTFSPHAGVDLTGLVEPQFVEFPAHDGLPLTGWLYRSAAESGAVVISFHGGPESQERPVFNNTYQALLERGIAVLAPNIRGSSGFGKTFVNLDNGALRANAIRDIKACIDYLVQNRIAKPGSIGIMGGSYGGYMTVAGLVEYADLIAAGACLYGLVNFETFFAQTEPWMAAISKKKYGDPETEAELLRQLSPIHKIDRVSSPTLVIHGATDTNCPVVEAEQVVESLKARSVPVQYILFADEGHGFRKIANRVKATAAIVDWFERYLTQ
ncbi:MAG TPA: S9 family peptidase [Chroococcales cyanobacterium]